MGIKVDGFWCKLFQHKNRFIPDMYVGLRGEGQGELSHGVQDTLFFLSVFLLVSCSFSVTFRCLVFLNLLLEEFNWIFRVAASKDACR